MQTSGTLEVPVINTCRVCDSRRLQPAVDLGMQPWCNDFLKKEELGKERYYPLRVVFCMDCCTAQLDYTVPKQSMFSNHTYLSGVTKSLSEHFKKVAQEVDSLVTSTKHRSVLDIGSNDGTQLKHFKTLGYDVLGVESCKTVADLARKGGISTIDAFFTLDIAEQLKTHFDVINAAGVFFHLEDLHSVADGIKYLLKNDGIFVVQFLYMKSIMENLAFDQIYHEHLLYYTLRTVEQLLNRHELALFDAYLSPIHGGSIIGFASHAGARDASQRLDDLRRKEDASAANEFETYVKFARQIDSMKERNLQFLNSAKSMGKRIYGFGAPAKGNTLLNYFGIGTNLLDCLVEKNPLRRNLYSPGMHIPLVMEDEVQAQPDIYYVLAWNFKDEILANNAKLVEQGVEFYFPVDPEVVPT